MEEVGRVKGLSHYLSSTHLSTVVPVPYTCTQTSNSTHIFKRAHAHLFAGACGLGFGYGTSSGMLTFPVRTAEC